MNMNSYNCCSNSSEEGKRVESLSSILKIVAEPSRLKLLCILNKGEHCVCEIMEHVDFSQSLVSHHLKDLKDIDAVSDEKRGQRVYYSLSKKGQHITSTLFKIVESRYHSKIKGLK
jgi:DNA-binding transcriptional ArsR family regulator